MPKEIFTLIIEEFDQDPQVRCFYDKNKAIAEARNIVIAAALEGLDYNENSIEIGSRLYCAQSDNGDWIYVLRTVIEE